MRVNISFRTSDLNNSLSVRLSCWLAFIMLSFVEAEINAIKNIINPTILLRHLLREGYSWCYELPIRIIFSALEFRQADEIFRQEGRIVREWALHEVDWTVTIKTNSISHSLWNNTWFTATAQDNIKKKIAHISSHWLFSNITLIQDYNFTFKAYPTLNSFTQNIADRMLNLITCS